MCATLDPSAAGEPPAPGWPTGAQVLVDTLAQLGALTVFGLPGVHNLALWEALRDRQIRLVGVRHEQTAVYAADGRARLSGELGVALTTTGPGAANAVAATGEAYACHSPVVVVATDIPSTLRRPGVVRGVLHESRDQAAMFAPVVKATLIADSAAQLPELMRRAAVEALTAPRGPVYLQIATDLLSAVAAPASVGAGGDAAAGTGAGAITPPALESEQCAPLAEEAIDAAVAALRAAERPLVWAGSGTVAAGAGRAVGELARRLGAPVLETYGARGLLGPDHPCAVGLPPHLPAVGALWDEADLVLAVGSDLDGMNTQNWLQPQPPTLVAINVDGADAGKNYRVDVMLEGDARTVVERLTEALAERAGEATLATLAARLRALRAAERARLTEEEPTALRFLDTLAATLPADTAIVCDMCIPGYWIAALHPFAGARQLAYPVGWGTLGFGFPASIGAALDRRDGVIAVVGDGGFMLGCGELATVAQEQPELTVVLVDDGGYGMLRYDQAQSGSPAFGVDLATPDFVALARAFGVRAGAVDDVGDPLAVALRDELAGTGPGMIVVSTAMAPPPTTSPRWYRRR
jgi:thiamine pyrophosphate-dependent acetolactate synthase large subunit-like protein